MRRYVVYYYKQIGVYDVDLNDLRKNHTPVCVIEANGLEDVFYRMQGEIWSPNGEARPLIETLGLHHTSMSIGDLVVDPQGMVYRCWFGEWQEIV